MNITLVCKNGRLYYPETVQDPYGDAGPILLRVYPEGDCDTISWPNPNPENLQAALFDGLESGFFGGDAVICTPDGNAVEF